ncbi:MAG TPA: ABC transporter substrate-binding protein [bacterium]
MRICSLVPSATEILFALGLGDQVVAVTHACDVPVEAASRPRVLRSRLDPEAEGGALDAEVRRARGAGESLYDVDESGLRAAAPEVVFAQDLCEVCAVSAADAARVVARLPGPPALVPLHPHRLQECLGDIRTIGQATGRMEAAEALIESLSIRIDCLRAMTHRARPRPRVVCLEWLDPLMISGHWIPELIALAGGDDVLGSPGAASRRVEPEEVSAADPDVVLIMPCGMRPDRAGRELDRLAGSPWWSALRAARAGRTYLMDGPGYLQRSGPRIIDGAEMLGGLFHPGVFRRPAPPGAVVRVAPRRAAERDGG